MRVSSIRLNTALILAVAVTALMIPAWSTGSAHWWSPPRLTLNWVLSWPAWYLVLMARKPGRVEAAV